MYDVLIRGCTVIDGTGNDRYIADVAVKDGKIASIKKDVMCKDVKAACEIDGEGCFLAPGFIDIHSHSDTTIMKYPKAESRLFQGVTTEIGGNCGISAAPVSFDKDRKEALIAYTGDTGFDFNSVGEFLDVVEKAKPSVNFGVEAGHGTIRIAAMGFDSRKADAKELDQMKELLREALEDGAFAMSSGLIYPPGCYADTEELIELSKVLSEYNNAFYATHMRNEGKNVVEAVKEAIEISEKSNVPLQISHHKVIEKSKWKSACFETTKLIEKAIANGCDISVDQYPYCASSTTMDSNISEWAFEGGMDALFERLRNPETRAILREECNKSHAGRWDTIYVGTVASEKNAWTVGKSIHEIAEIEGRNPADVCFDLVLDEKGRVDEINFGMCEEDIEYIMKKPYVMTGSDGKAMDFGYPGKPHPRGFGTFARVLSHYCLGRGIISLESAVNKMTAMPAKRLGITDRGLIKEGMWADMVIFDESIRDLPDFDNPKQKCAGIRKVFVNGILTIDNGEHTGASAGMILRRRSL